MYIVGKKIEYMVIFWTIKQRKFKQCKLVTVKVQVKRLTAGH